MFRADPMLRRAYQVSSAIGWGVLGAALLLVPWLDSLPAWVLYAPFLLSVIAFGLPHGAVDHVVATSGANRESTLSRQALFCAGYLGLAVVVIALWFLAPLLSVAAFLALTIWHWGSGDFHVLLGRPQRPPDNATSWALPAILLRGCLPIGLPFVFWPAESLKVVHSLAALFGGEVNPSAALAGSLRVWTLAIFGIIGSFYVSRKFFSKDNFGNKRDNWTDAGEVAFLVLFFALLPPVFAVGLYFVFWHSMRHLARLAVWQRAENIRESRPARWSCVVARLGLRCVPMTLGALGLTALLGLGVTLRPGQAQDWLALYLVFIAAVTVPHALVVAWMDRRDGLRCFDFLPGPPPKSAEVRPNLHSSSITQKETYHA
ncbi:MAG: Brp/Blh family beta-carotene 15,15'-dioxygenase [Opitutales bacterium]